MSRSVRRLTKHAMALYAKLDAPDCSADTSRGGVVTASWAPCRSGALFLAEMKLLKGPG